MKPVQVSAIAGRPPAAHDPEDGLLDVRAGRVVVRPPARGSSRLLFEMWFPDEQGYLLEAPDGRRLAGMLRAHAALAHRALPWQPDEEPSGKPSKARHRNPPDGGWIQCWTPWPPPEPAVVWVRASGTVAVLDFAQAVRVADALDEAAAKAAGGTGP